MMKLHKLLSSSLFRGDLANVIPILVLSFLILGRSWAVVLHVAPDGDDQNSGSESLPLRTIQVALNLVVAGDEILVSAGSYQESLRTQSSGTASAAIVLAGSEPGAVVIRPTNGTALRISHPYYVVENLVFDGSFSKHDVVRVASDGDGLMFTRNVVQNGAKDGIDLGKVATKVGAGFDYLDNVVITESTFKNFLAKDLFGNRTDAHGIVAGGVRHLTIQNSLVEMVSGDALQLANGNWDSVSVESVVFRNFPVTAELAAKTGFAEGVSPGENAIDTKQDSALPVRSRLTVGGSEFSGWAGDLISNAAALNLKEKVDVRVDRCLFTENEIALRLRGGGQSDNGAIVSVSNSVFYANDKALRLEDNLLNFKLIHNSFGAGNGVFVEMAGDGAGVGFFAANNVFFTARLPKRISAAANMALGESDFVDVESHDYRLRDSSLAIDSAAILLEYATDYLDVTRPQGVGTDFGAFERRTEIPQGPTSGVSEVIGAPR